MDATLKLVRYIKNAQGLGILPKRSPVHSLVAFCDLDWERVLSLEGLLVDIWSSLGTP